MLDRLPVHGLRTKAPGTSNGRDQIRVYRSVELHRRQWIATTAGPALNRGAATVALGTADRYNGAVSPAPRKRSRTTEGSAARAELVGRAMIAHSTALIAMLAIIVLAVAYGLWRQFMKR